MARVRFAEEQELTGEAKKAWDEQTANQNLTNMKKALLQIFMFCNSAFWLTVAQ